MNIKKYTILFTLIYREEEYQIQSRLGQYHSLMSLISDQLPTSGFGLCSGMGSCGTCLVVIDGTPALSCAVQVNDDLANTRVEMKEDYF
jgi:aerobic-type carbon monoxide dehydrogenase small subunit (CoxS/CutS family)